MPWGTRETPGQEFTLCLLEGAWFALELCDLCCVFLPPTPHTHTVKHGKVLWVLWLLDADSGVWCLFLAWCLNSVRTVLGPVWAVSVAAVPPPEISPS